MLIKLDNRVYLVSFVVDGYKYFLKTIFPSTKLTKLLVTNKL